MLTRSQAAALASTAQAALRQHHTCYFRKRATPAPAKSGGEIHNVSRSRARTQVLPQARKSRVYTGAARFGACWTLIETPGPRSRPRLRPPAADRRSPRRGRAPARRPAAVRRRRSRRAGPPATPAASGPHRGARRRRPSGAACSRGRRRRARPRGAPGAPAGIIVIVSIVVVILSTANYYY